MAKAKWLAELKVDCPACHLSYSRLIVSSNGPNRSLLALPALLAVSLRACRAMASRSSSRCVTASIATRRAASASKVRSSSNTKRRRPCTQSRAAMCSRASRERPLSADFALAISGSITGFSPRPVPLHFVAVMRFALTEQFQRPRPGSRQGGRQACAMLAFFLSRSHAVNRHDVPCLAASDFGSGR